MNELINIINISKNNVGISVYVPSLKEKKYLIYQKVRNH